MGSITLMFLLFMMILPVRLVVEGVVCSKQLYLTDRGVAGQPSLEPEGPVDPAVHSHRPPLTLVGLHGNTLVLGCVVSQFQELRNTLQRRWRGERL